MSQFHRSQKRLKERKREEKRDIKAQRRAERKAGVPPEGPAEGVALPETEEPAGEALPQDPVADATPGDVTEGPTE
jgi:hypothetical protein